MPHSKSSKKDLIRSRLKQARNRAYRSRLRTYIKRAKTSIAADPVAPDTDGAFREACRQLDKMVTKGIIHANQAARKKSRMAQARRKGATATA